MVCTRLLKVHASVVLALAVLALPLAAAEFTPLGMLPDANHSSAFGISPDGNYVVGRSGTMSFRWSHEEGMIKVSDYNTADDVTNDGIVVGGNGSDVAYRWDDGALTIIGDLTTIGRTETSPGGTRMSSAHGVSADGTVIVGNTSIDANGEADSFRIVGDLIEPIGDFPGGPHTSGIRGVSADGAIAVGYGISDAGQEAMRWENGIRESLGDLAGGELFSWATKVSADGQVIVGRSDSATGIEEAFRWTRETGMVGLGYIPGAASNDSRAWDVSGDGAVVVGVHNNTLPPASRNAFIWDEATGMRDLQEVLIAEYGLADQLAGWDLGQVRAISDDGTRIAGTAGNPEGLIEAFLVDLRQGDLLSGDYNGSGTVEQADLDLVLLNWGEDAARVADSWVNDPPTGRIDQDELDGVLLNWGNSGLATAASPAAVPEPSTISYLLICLLGVWIYGARVS